MPKTTGGNMAPDEIRAILQEKNIPFEEKAIQNGTQFRCRDGEIFSVYKTGAVVCGGKITELSKLIEKQSQGDKAMVPAAQPAPADAIFVVYGHDKQARDDLELLLRRMGLNPVIFANLPAEGETIIEKLEAYIGHGGKAAYAFVLVTPDDEGRKVGDVGPLKYRARQNVVLELGMVLAKLGRKRVAILRKQTVEQPSDIDGLLYIPFAERIEEIKLRIIQELQAAGFKPRL
jgi:predicted nucleotide-binding protein